LGGGGKISSKRAVFFDTNLAPGAILFYQGGDILRGRCYFVTPAHVAETMKFMADLKAFGWDLWVAVIHQMSPRSWALLTNLTWQNQRGKKTRPFNPHPKLLVRAGGRHVPKAQGLKRCGQGSRPCNRKGARWDWQTDRLSAHYSKIVCLLTTG